MIWLLRVALSLVVLAWLRNLVAAVRGRKRARWRLDPERPGPPLVDGAPVRVAVVIPARDEAANIGPCVESVMAQDHAGVHCFVLDDGSSDGTGQILSELQARFPGRLTVLRGGDAPLPEGWKGKPWACQRAARQAIQAHDPAWLLFIDADVRLLPTAVRAALGDATEHQVALLSGLGKLVMQSFWEKMLQPAVAGLIIAGNDFDRVNDAKRRQGPPLANGQFLLFARAAYEQIGGHEAVRDNVLDDVGMATTISDAGLPYRLLYMRQTFECRMYDSLGSLWEGWSKNLFAGMGRSWVAVLIVQIVLFWFVILPYLLVPAGLLGWLPLEAAVWGGVAVLLIQAVRGYLDRVFEQDPRYGLGHMPATVFLMALILNSGLKSLRGTATWKGRVLG